MRRVIEALGSERAFLVLATVVAIAGFWWLLSRGPAEEELAPTTTQMAELHPEAPGPTEPTQPEPAEPELTVEEYLEQIKTGEIKYYRVPNDKRTEEYWQLVLDRGDVRLFDVPAGMITYRMALKEVRKNPKNVISVPLQMRDTEMLIAVLEHEDGASLLAYDVVPSWQCCDEVFSRAYFEKGGKDVRLIHESLRTPSLLAEMVRRDSDNFRFIPAEKVTREIAEAAVLTTPGLLSQIPREMVIEDDCSLAFMAFRRSDRVKESIPEFCHTLWYAGRMPG